MSLVAAVERSASLRTVLGHQTEGLALHARTRSLDSRVEREDVGFRGDIVEQLDDLANLVGTRLQRLQLARDLSDGRLLAGQAFGHCLVGAPEPFRGDRVWLALPAIWLACRLRASSIWLSARGQECQGRVILLGTHRQIAALAAFTACRRLSIPLFLVHGLVTV